MLRPGLATVLAFRSDDRFTRPAADAPEAAWARPRTLTRQQLREIAQWWGEFDMVHGMGSFRGLRTVPVGVLVLDSVSGLAEKVDGGQGRGNMTCDNFGGPDSSSCWPGRQRGRLRRRSTRGYRQRCGDSRIHRPPGPAARPEVTAIRDQHGELAQAPYQGLRTASKVSTSTTWCSGQ